MRTFSLSAASLVVSLLAVACAPAPPCAMGECPDASTGTDATPGPDVPTTAVDGADAPAMPPEGALLDGHPVYTPYLAGPFERVYRPSGTRYLNDHTLVRGPDGRWHVYGITDDSLANPFAEGEFLHATAPTILGPWTEHPDAVTADPTIDGCCIWAPHVIEPTPGRWLMHFFSAQSSTRGLRRAESRDLDRWERSPAYATDAGRPPGGRDPFVLRHEGRWLLFSVGVDATSHGQIVVSTSSDIDAPGSAWSEPRAVITDPVASFGWGNLESPFVVPYEGLYYLFLTRTFERAERAYWSTNVFVSSDPTAFTWSPITEIIAHAAEVSREGDDWYLSSAGWTTPTGELYRGLSIAPLLWARRPAGI